jgi:hypothetical protein
MRVHPFLLLAAPLALLGMRCAEPYNHVPLLEAVQCPLMPPDSYWHADVRGLPVLPRSDDWIARMGADQPLLPRFGSGLAGQPAGIPVTVVGSNMPRVPVTFRFFLDSDSGPYPIPSDVPVGSLDRRVIVLDRDACTLYELREAALHSDGSWTADAGAIFDLASYDLRAAGRMSADDAGLPILPGLVRYEKVGLGLVGHALRFSTPSVRRDALWPARYSPSSTSASDLPPMGTWLRLKASVDPAGFSPGVRPIVEALQRHGMILADVGEPWALSGVPHEHWDDGALAELGSLVGADFEAVDVSSLMVAPDSAAIASEADASALPAAGTNALPGAGVRGPSGADPSAPGRLLD